MATTTPYCTNAEADTFLALDVDNWPGLSDAEKTEALKMGRYYIDSIWDCNDRYTDDTDAPDELKWANAIAGNLHSQGKLYEQEKEVSEVSVQAGSVSSTKRYAVATVDKVDIPEMKQIRALLKGVCVSVGSGVVGLVRD